jgi:hypothetical protein
MKWVKSSILGAVLLVVMLAGCTTTNYGSASRTSGPFQAQYNAQVQNPEIIIENNSSITITLNLTGPESETMVIGPHGSKKSTVLAGNYAYRASSPGVQSATGNSTFEKHHQYTWTFSVQTVTY